MRVKILVRVVPLQISSAARIVKIDTLSQDNYYIMIICKFILVGTYLETVICFYSICRYLLESDTDKIALEIDICQYKPLSGNCLALTPLN